MLDSPKALMTFFRWAAEEEYGTGGAPRPVECQREGPEVAASCAPTNNGVYFLTTWNFTVLSVNRPQRMAIPSSTANMGINTTCANTMSQLIPWV